MPYPSWKLSHWISPSSSSAKTPGPPINISGSSFHGWEPWQPGTLKGPPVIHASSPVSSRVAHLLQSGGLDQPASNSARMSFPYSRQSFPAVHVYNVKWFYHCFSVELRISPLRKLHKNIDCTVMNIKDFFFKKRGKSITIRFIIVQVCISNLSLIYKNDQKVQINSLLSNQKWGTYIS